MSRLDLNDEWIIGLYGPDPSAVPAGDEFGDMAWADLPHACGFAQEDIDGYLELADIAARDEYEDRLRAAHSWADAARAWELLVYTVDPEEVWSGPSHYVPGRCECCGGHAPRGQLCATCRAELQ